MNANDLTTVLIIIALLVFIIAGVIYIARHR